jgi:rsbT co-antagonist protein RsbR
MPTTRPSHVSDVFTTGRAELLEAWLEEQAAATDLRARLSADDLRRESAALLDLIAGAVGVAGATNIAAPAWASVQEYLTAISRSRAQSGFTPTETAMFVFSLKQPLFGRLREAWKADGESLAEDIWRASLLLDRLGLMTAEAFQAGREAVIRRQQADMLELSTPVVRVWDGILAVPLIGTLDSTRTQVVMESLLQTIVDTGSSIAIVDITGVPVVDTLVAQHLLKTAAAARLMGAQCIVSGVRPQTAQTIVHLGVELGDLVTKATLADALAYAFRLTGIQVSRSPLLP